ncbi:MAG: hypothetical protein JNL82_37640 [Myxococcales bacterium]|nr:hypothetical protein [Myxococcales bacterium]
MATIPLPARMYPVALGYFAFPLTSADAGLEEFAAWKIFADQVAAAKQGHFASGLALLELYDNDDDWVRRGAYVELIGDAGPDALLEHVHRLFAAGLPIDYSYDFAAMLFHWGRLDVVPTLVEIYRVAFEFQDARYIPPRLGLLLEEEPGPLGKVGGEVSAAEAAAVCELALTHHAALRARHGEHAYIFRGRLLDVEWIARCALADLARGEMDPEMRRKFEATTGIDCSSFYRDRRIQPLSAAKVLEDFLQKPRRLVPGRRYFFGHPVPAAAPPAA